MGRAPWPGLPLPDGSLFAQVSADTGVPVGALVVLLAFSIFVGVFALARGEAAERWGGVVVLLTPLNIIWHTTTFETLTRDVDWPLGAFNLALLWVLGRLALTSNRPWTLWAAAFQALLTATYLVLAFDLRISNRSAETAIMFWSFWVKFCVLYGTVRVLRRDRAPDGKAASALQDR